jgi:hypothetical protein
MDLLVGCRGCVGCYRLGSDAKSEEHEQMAESAEREEQ